MVFSIEAESSSIGRETFTTPQLAAKNKTRPPAVIVTLVDTIKTQLKTKQTKKNVKKLADG